MFSVTICFQCDVAFKSWEIKVQASWKEMGSRFRMTVLQDTEEGARGAVGPGHPQKLL